MIRETVKGRESIAQQASKLLPGGEDGAAWARYCIVLNKAMDPFSYDIFQRPHRPGIVLPRYIGLKHEETV
jgi:hypothetical protein